MSTDTTPRASDASAAADPVLKSTPEDFVVEEIPAYVPSGHGEHVYVTFRKRDLTTFHAVARLAQAAGIDPSRVSTAGMKDRVGVTTQTASLHVPRSEPGLEQKLAALDGPELSVLAVSRHDNKLKTGHLRGNRFVLRVRGVNAEQAARAQLRLEQAREHGMPNAFGVQRFGRHGDNAEEALRFLRGERRPPRDKKLQRLLFSALQSALFNELLERRMAEGSWQKPEVGDLVMRHRRVLVRAQEDGSLDPEDERGALFACKAEDAASVLERAARGEVSPTGPLFGPRMRACEGRVAELEREVLGAKLGADFVWPDRFALGDGARRSLCLRPEAISTRIVAPLGPPHASNEAVAETPQIENDMLLQFVLPKGAYATEVLAWAFPDGLRDASRPARESCDD